MASSPHLHSNLPQWKELYEAAVLELDRRKLSQRIQEAEQAIVDCLKKLDDSAGLAEKESLNNALQVLHDLRKIAAKDGISEIA